MKLKQLPALLVSVTVWGLSAAVVVVSTLNGGDSARDVYLLLVAVIVVLLGELLEVDLRGGRSTPVSNAVVFALFVVMQSPVEVLVAVVPAFFVAMVLRSGEIGWGPRFRSTSRRLATTILALAAYRILADLIPPLGLEQGDLIAKTVAMIGAGFLYLVLDTGLSSAFVCSEQRIPLFPVWKSRLQGLSPLHVAFLSVSTLIALAYDVLGIWAFILFVLPLFAAQYSFRRYASIHRTYTQTIRALSKLPELSGYSPPGHSVRVAELAASLGRRMGLSDAEVQEIEFAALLHDIGTLSFDDPKDGAVHIDQGKLAAASAEVIGQTPYLERVARVVRDVDLPFRSGRLQHSGMVGSRIVRAVNSFVEMTYESDQPLTVAEAIERIEQGSGTTYDPQVVKALRGTIANREPADFVKA